MVLNPYINKKNQDLDNSDSKNMKELSETTAEFLSNGEIKSAIVNLVKCLKDPVSEKGMSCKSATGILENADNNYYYKLEDLSDLYASHVNLMGSNNHETLEIKAGGDVVHG